MRLDYKQRVALMERLNVDRLWSYSRLSTFLEHPFDYRIAYLEKSARSDNIYGVFGTYCHDIVQDYTDGKYDYDEMLVLFEKKIEEWKNDNKGFTFPNEKIEISYFNNLRHYFSTTTLPDAEIENEIPVLLNLYDKVREKPISFFGYLDAIYTDSEGITHIVDYKTSSKSGFSGASLKDKSKQLMLYACAISKMRGIPLEKINLRFDMMKYVNVWYQLKNGTWKSTMQERQKWVAGIEKKIRKIMVDLEMDFFEIDVMVSDAILHNSLDGLPEEVRKSFKLSNAYIDVSISDEEAVELEQFLIESVRDCEEKEVGDWDVNFPEPSVEELGGFYYTVLAPQIRNKATRWNENKELLTKKGKSTVAAPPDDFFASLFAK